MVEVRKSKYPFPTFFIWDGGKGAGRKHRVIEWTEPVLNTKCGLQFVWQGQMCNPGEERIPWCGNCKAP